MLNPDQITAVARNLIGHMTTDPAVRNAIDAIDGTAPDANDRYAAVITAATQSHPVTPEDVPAIFAAIKDIASANPMLAPTSAIAFTVVYVKSAND
jgi:hypothetical protein